MSNWIDFKKLREQLDVREVLAHYGIELKIKGRQASGFCPLPGHDGKRRSPSFSVNLDKGIWQCFGCRAKGNTLDFACCMEGLDPDRPADIRKAALIIQEAFGLDTSNGRQQLGKTGHSQERHQIANTATKDCPDSKAKINSPLDFELKGLDPRHPYLQDRGLQMSTIEAFNLGYCSRGLMKGRIAIPIHDSTGALIGYAGRLVKDEGIDADTPKYMLPPPRERDGVTYEFRKSMVLYNLHRIHQPVDQLIVVEGYPSVWWLSQSGFPNVVALMGATCSQEQGLLIEQATQDTGRVLLMPDGDKAGRECALEVFDRVASQRRVEWIKVEHCKQPTDYSATALQRLID